MRVKGITFTLDPLSNKKLTFPPLFLFNGEYKRPLGRGHGSVSGGVLVEMLRMTGMFLLTSLLTAHDSSSDEANLIIS